ncbi:endolytic transglycosylase MltG [Paenibacillus alkalitolerans]|uniref:endolytic transglycosylase MltG n=1 Tax=Paenibacillus alkalitolerans TaxID=2799335 RepID=UPI001F1EDD95|nr:endolytic transglycosylase MltG [Paenibacillus alkalitolerans]
MKIWKIVTLIGTIAIGVVAGLGLYTAKQLQPTDPSDIPILVEIPEGTHSQGIADILEEERIIRNGKIFSYYLKYKGFGSDFQAGIYEMKPGMPIADIIRQLSSGETVKEEVIRITVPEGFTAARIIDLLAEEHGFSRDALAGLIRSRKAVEEAQEEADKPVWAATVPDNPDYKYMMEGYLFPETYELPKDAAPEHVVRRMLLELDNKVKQLPEGWEERLTELGISFHKMLTIASLIEREVTVDKERAIVAGVIYNRLQRNMPLQLDATVQYLFDKQKDRLFEKDLQIESPYNTYRNNGLPPGPIASPGLKSIEAALYPEETKYLYYVTKKDGSGEHYFAETYEQHLKNIKESKRSQ